MDNVVMVALANTVNEAFIGHLNSKSDYDFYRGIIWANFATLADAITNYRDSGQLTPTILSEYIDAVAELVDRFNTVTTDVAYRVDSSWILPRFHDYFDFMVNMGNGWRDELAAMTHVSEASIPTVEVPVSIDDRKEGNMPALLATLASTFTNAISKLNPASWFGKSKDKTNYDNYRATVWESMASIVDQLTVIRQSGQLDYVTLKTCIDGLTQILAQFKTYTDGVAPSIGSDWVMPRFHDYYDFMNGQLNGWRNELLTLPQPSIIGSLFGTTPKSQVVIPGIPGSTQPVNRAGISDMITQNPLVVLGLVAGLVMFMGHKQR